MFLVGGGGAGGKYGSSHCGGGGGAGYTNTAKNISVAVFTKYSIDVGGSSGDTNAFEFIAAAGKKGKTEYTGGNGGSGGASYKEANKDYKGGIDGYGPTNQVYPGKGQREVPGPNGETGTTREFGETRGKLYATGGDGYYRGLATANTGNGGDGGDSSDDKAGASGIIVIRNSR